MQEKNGNDVQKKSRAEFKNAKDELVRRDRQKTRQVAPSLDYMQQTTSSGSQLVLPSDSERRKLYSEITKKQRTKNAN